MKQFLIYTLFLSFAFACKPKPEENICLTNPSECQYTSEAKAFFSFKVGSWWVYEEQTTLERDSVYVTSANNNLSTQDFDTYLFSVRDSFNTHYFPADFYSDNGCSYPGPVNKRCLYIRKTKFKFQTHLGESTVMFFYYNLGESQYTGGGLSICETNKITITNICNNFSIGSLTFDKSIEISEDCTHFENDQPVKYTYSKDIGLIKKMLINSNKTWNLVAYHIEQ